MKSKMKRIEKIERRKRISIQERTKYNYAIYKCLKTASIKTQFGDLLIPQGETVFSPHHITFDKELIYTLEDGFKKFTDKTDLHNSSLLIIRYGGIGDLVASLFGINELKNKFSNLKIGYIASPSYSDILLSFPKLVDQVFDIVIDYNEIKKYKYFCVLDNTVENNNEDSLHDIYSKNLNIELKDSTLNNVICHNIGYSNIGINNRSGIGIQYTSGSFIRNYNIDKLIETINLIHNDYPNEPIHLLGQSDDWTNINYIKTFCNFPIVSNGCGLKSYSLKEITYVVSSLKLVIGPDSSMLHIAGVCNTPMIGLFGPFNSDKRLSHYQNVTVLEGKSECSPCNRHFPINFCPYTFGEGLCLNEIQPNQILNQVKKILG